MMRNPNHEEVDDIRPGAGRLGQPDPEYLGPARHNTTADYNACDHTADDVVEFPGPELQPDRGV
jgi:hypothetical protein